MPAEPELQYPKLPQGSSETNIPYPTLPQESPNTYDSNPNSHEKQPIDEDEFIEALVSSIYTHWSDPFLRTALKDVLYLDACILGARKVLDQGYSASEVMERVQKWVLKAQAGIDSADGSFVAPQPPMDDKSLEAAREARRFHWNVKKEALQDVIRAAETLLGKRLVILRE